MLQKVTRGEKLDKDKRIAELEEEVVFLKNSIKLSDLRIKEFMKERDENDMWMRKDSDMGSIQPLGRTL